MKYIISILFLLLLFSLGYFNGGPAANYELFRLMNIIVVFFVLWRAFSYFRKDSSFFLLNPFFTTILITYFLNFGLFSNFIFLQDGRFKVSDYNLNLDYDMYWYKVAMFNIGLSFFGLFIGFENGIGPKLSRIVRSLFSKIIKLFSYTEENIILSKKKLILLLLLVNLFRFWQLSVGIYGRLASDETIQSISYQQVSQFIKIINSASLGVLFFFGFLYQKKEISKFYFYIIFLIELFWGFMAGSRGTFLMPILIIILSGYIVNNKFKKSSFVKIGLALFISMVIVVPFKNFYGQYRGTELTTNPITLLNEFYKYYIQEENLLASVFEDPNTYNSSQHSWYYTFFHQTNYSTEIAASIRHNDLFGLDSQAPSFLNDIVFSPIYAIVPRFIWTNKSTSIHGLWFRENILFHNIGQGTTSIAMTPLGYLYFAGGSLAIFLGFWLVGILKRSIFDLLYSRNLANLILFLTMFSNFYYIDSSFHSIIIDFIRNIFIAVIGVVIFCKVKK